MDGVEEDHLLLGALHRAARLHADRQLDHRFDRAEAKLVVGLFAQHRRADLKHGTKLPEEEKVGKLSQKGFFEQGEVGIRKPGKLSRLGKALGGKEEIDYHLRVRTRHGDASEKHLNITRVN